MSGCAPCHNRAGKQHGPCACGPCKAGSFTDAGRLFVVTVEIPPLTVGLGLVSPPVSTGMTRSTRACA